MVQILCRAVSAGAASICIGNSFSHALSPGASYSGALTLSNLTRATTPAPSAAPLSAAPTPAPSRFGGTDAVVDLTFKMVIKEVSAVNTYALFPASILQAF
jgi:hypothetical protein